MILSNVGTWVQIIAQSLLVLQLTHNSGLALGLISFAQAAPFLVFSLVGESTADRVDKRRLLLVTQSLQIVYAFTLGVLTITGVVQFWQIGCSPSWRGSRSALTNRLDLRLFRG